MTESIIPKRSQGENPPKDTIFENGKADLLQRPAGNPQWSDFFRRLQDTGYLVPPKSTPKNRPSRKCEDGADTVDFLRTALPRFFEQTPRILSTWRNDVAQREKMVQTWEQGDKNVQETIDPAATAEAKRLFDCCRIGAIALTYWGKVAMRQTGDEQLLNGGIDYLETLFRIFEQAYPTDRRIYNRAWGELGDYELLDIYLYGSDESSDRIKGLGLAYWDNLEFPFQPMVKNALGQSDALAGLGKRKFDREKAFFADTIGKTGRPWEEVLQLWLNAESNYEAYSKMEKGGLHNAFVKENISKILGLENYHTGTTQILSQDYGILEFRRYPDSVLVRQYEERESSLPYGLIILPRADHNDSFATDTHIWNKMNNELKQLGFTQRFIEVRSKMDVARRLVQLDKAFSSKAGKIKFVIIGGHGSPTSIHLGFGLHSRHAIKTGDVFDTGFIRTQTFLDDKAPIVLLSCSTGADVPSGSISSTLSKSLNRKVFAPDKDTGVNSIVPRLLPDGNIAFDVKYATATTRSFSTGKQEK